MIGVLLVTHGSLGQELLKSAEGIIGKQGLVRVLGLESAEGPAGYEGKVRCVLEEMNSTAGVLVLADAMGGTPCNAVLRLSRLPHLHFEIVTAVNLPMLVSALANRHYMPLDQLAEKLTEDAVRNVVRPLRKLKEEPGEA